MNHIVLEMEEDHDERVEEYGSDFDDISGTQLDPTLVRAARDEEISEIITRNMYTVVPISDCWTVTGKKPIGVRFVDVNKGDNSNLN